MGKEKIFDVNDKYDHGKTIRYFEEYKKGQHSDDEWAVYLVDTLKHYIKYLIRLDNRMAAGGIEYDDLIEAGIEAILKKYKEYDPSISTPSSFFSCKIRGAMRTACTDAGIMTEHYVKMTKKLETSLREYGYSGIEDVRLSLDTISAVSGMSMEVVKNILAFKDVRICPLLEFDQKTQYMMSPEQELLEKERKEFLEKELASCTPLERYLLLNYAEEKPKKMLWITKKLHSDERFRSKFHKDLVGMSKEQVSQVFLERTLNTAIKRIQRDVLYMFDENPYENDPLLNQEEFVDVCELLELEDELGNMELDIQQDDEYQEYFSGYRSKK